MANPAFNFHTTPSEITSAYSARITGATILITGVSPNGLGLTTTLALSSHSPGLLILAGRTPSTLAAASAEITAASPTCPIKLLTLDLSSTRTVRAAAAEVNSWMSVPHIDILINNAGIMACPWQASEDGIESQFATNHIGTWLFTNVLMPKLVAAWGRIVFLSSIAHMYGPVCFEDWNFAVRWSADREKKMKVCSTDGET